MIAHENIRLVELMIKQIKKRLLGLFKTFNIENKQGKTCTQYSIVIIHLA